MNSTATKEMTTHTLPKKLYFTVGFTLLALTSITVWVATFDFGPWNMVVAMSLAALKASLVILFFMHLYYDSKIYAIILATSLLFLALFIILILFDTTARGALYTQVENPINPHAMIYGAFLITANRYFDSRLTIESS